VTADLTRPFFNHTLRARVANWLLTDPVRRYPELQLVAP
jgi:hypothetical protein